MVKQESGRTYETSSLFFGSHGRFFRRGSNAQETPRIDGLEIIVSRLTGKNGLFSQPSPGVAAKTSTIWNYLILDHHHLDHHLRHRLSFWVAFPATIRAQPCLPLPFAPHAVEIL